MSSELFRTDVAVIGAGPAGIVTALELAKKGLHVCLIESGSTRRDSQVQRLGDAANYDPRRHAPMDLATCRQLGGATNIWGGRVVPYDPVDFAERDYIPHSKWPVSFSELTTYFPAACNYFQCGQPIFNAHGVTEISQKGIVPRLPDGDVRSSDLERWSLPTNFGKEYGRELERNSLISVLKGWTCVKLAAVNGDSHVTSAQLASLGGKRAEVVASRYVIACGALETTRLLLSSGDAGKGLGNQSGWLGRCYMGHISGRIARTHFRTDPAKTHYGFLRDRGGVYLRQRFTFAEEFQRQRQLTNITMWLSNPVIGDPSHRNGVLSFIYLALASPFGRWFASDAIRKSALKHFEHVGMWPHFFNLLRSGPRTAAFIPTFAAKRFLLRRKIPGFFQYAHNNCYDLHYHGEQTPNWDSRATLCEQRDDVGMRRLAIDLRYRDQDVDSVVRAHEYLDEYLRRHGVGELEYLTNAPERSVWDQAADGYHQIGTTRMASRPEDGVVDKDCRVFGVDNLFIASSSTFVTSGQANTTFMIVVFALRLADHLNQIHATPEESIESGAISGASPLLRQMSTSVFRQ